MEQMSALAVIQPSNIFQAPYMGQILIQCASEIELSFQAPYMGQIECV